MNSVLENCYTTLMVAIIYVCCLLWQKRYRLLLPSTVNTFIWGVTAFLMLCELRGFMVIENAIIVEMKFG